MPVAVAKIAQVASVASASEAGIGPAASDALHREDDLGCGGQRVGAGGHDRRSGMIGAAADRHPSVIDAHDVADDPERKPRRL